MSSAYLRLSIGDETIRQVSGNTSDILDLIYLYENMSWNDFCELFPGKSQAFSEEDFCNLDIQFHKRTENREWKLQQWFIKNIPVIEKFIKKHPAAHYMRISSILKIDEYTVIKCLKMIKENNV